MLSCFFLPLGMLVQSVLDLVLALLDGGKPGDEASVFHLLLMVTHGQQNGGPCLDHDSPWGGHGSHEQRGYTFSLVATGDLLIWLLLIVIKVVILPLCTQALMPGTLQMMRRRLLPPSMYRLVHTGRSRLVPTCMLRKVNLGRSCLIKSCVAGEGRAF